MTTTYEINYSWNPADRDDEGNMYSQDYYAERAGRIAEKVDKKGYSLRELMDFDDLVFEIPKQFR